MSGAQVSSAPNVLFDPLMAGRQQAQQNTLMQQQQELTDHDVAMTGQAAAPLLNMSEQDAAAAYPGWLQDMQRQGLAKYAPPTYPGHAATQALVQRAIPLVQQYNLGIMVPPGLTAALGGTPPGGQPPAQGGQPPATGGQAAMPAPGGAYGAGGPNQAQVPAEYMPFYQEASQRTGIPVDVLIAQHRQESGFNPNAVGRAGEIGIGQIMPSTAMAPGYGVAPIDPATLKDPRTNINFSADYLRARLPPGTDPSDPAAIRRALLNYNGGGDPNYVANVTRYLPASAGGGTAVASTATSPPRPTTATTGGPVVVGDSLASSGGLGGSGVVGASPGAVRAQIMQGVQNGAYTGKDVVLSSGASNAPGDMENVEAQLKLLRDAGSVKLLGVGPGIEAKNPGTNAALQKLAAQYGAEFVPLPADQMSPGGVHPTAAGYASLKTATAPPGAAPQGGRYQVASNAPVPPPASTAPPGPPAAAPAAPVVAQGAQPPAPAPTQPPASTAAASRANLPHYTDIPTGQNSQPYQEAQRIQQQISQLMPYAALPAAKAKIAQLQQQQQLLMQTDSVVQTQEGPYHPLTGVLDEPRKPLPNYVYNPNAGGPGVPGFVDTTGTNKPEFEPAQRDAAVAQRTVMDLGPKIAAADAGTGPPVSPEDRGRYAVAAETYVQPVLRESKVSGETVRVPTRELPPGFPKPTGLGGPGASGGSNVVIPGYSPAQQQVERDPAAYKVAESQYDRDSKEVSGIADAGRAAQADQIRIKEMQDVLQRFSTGPGTEWRTAASAFLQRWLPSAVTGWEKESANLSGADAAQAFSKLALTGAGSQERSVLGNRGGFQAIRMFQAANPSINLQDATNKSILDMQLISNQANQDYAQAALSHFADNEKKFSQTHQYDSLAQFDRSWNQQRSPEVYAAAMGAIGGQPASQWTKGLSDDEYARALQIVQRAKPSAVVQTKNGPYSMQPNAVTSGPQQKSGDTVIRFDHNGNRIQQ